MQEPRWLDTEEQQTWLTFLNVGGLLNRRLGQQLERDSGLSHLQYEILVRLDDAATNEMRMSDLAAVLLNSKSKLTYQIDRLEQSGLVRRRSSSNDMRAVYAVITESGRRKLQEAAPGHVAAVRDLFIDVLSAEQLDAIRLGLGEVLRRMRTEN